MPMVPKRRPDETIRLLRTGGLVAWLMVGLPVLLRPPLSAVNFGLWLVAFFAFGALFRYTVARPSRRALLLALEAACVIGMVLTLCNGFEGTLMVLVAMQLPGRTTRREGLLWITAQSLLLGWAVQAHWSLPPALLLAPPYFGFQVFAYLVIELLFRESQARRELAGANAELRSLQGVLEERSRLAERVRISEELHDAMGHHLTALSLNLEVAAQQARGDALENVQLARSIARLLLADVREIVGSLKRPAPTVDLSESLRALARDLPAPRVHLKIADGLRVDDPDRTHVLLRCAQEIVTNAARHARAQNLWLAVARTNGRVELHGHDDGRGAEPVTEGAGLRGMRDRVARVGGELEVSSRLGGGFDVRVRL